MNVDCTFSEEKRGTVICLADLRLDPVRRKLWRNDKEIDLGSKECSLLIFFMHHPNQSLSRIMIAAHVWGSADPNLEMVDFYMSSLRKKIDIIPDKKLFYTIRRFGYFFEGRGMNH